MRERIKIEYNRFGKHELSVDGQYLQTFKHKEVAQRTGESIVAMKERSKGIVVDKTPINVF